MSRQPQLRSLPRVFIPGATADEPIDLPAAEVEKFRKVLRLEAGAQVAVLPNDGTVIRCRYQGRQAIPESVETPQTEPETEVTIIQALPKGDRIETVLRMGTEIGVRRFVLFTGIRSVARWEPSKVKEKMRRLEAILSEAAEQSYRTRLPELEWTGSLTEAMKAYPDAIPLSEVEGLPRSASEVVKERLASGEKSLAFVVGPEGGWDPKELALFGDRGVTLGPLVLRTDTAGVVAATIGLLR